MTSLIRRASPKILQHRFMHKILNNYSNTTHRQWNTLKSERIVYAASSKSISKCAIEYFDDKSALECQNLCFELLSLLTDKARIWSNTVRDHRHPVTCHKSDSPLFRHPNVTTAHCSDSPLFRQKQDKKIKI